MLVVIFHVEEACRQLGLRVSAVIFRGVNITARTDLLREEIAKEVETIAAKYSTPQAIRALPEVIAFQEILRKVNVNPRKVQPSVERLLNFVFKRRDLPAINNFVDAYNLASVRTLCSLGAHDLDRIALPASLRLLMGRETFTPLGREANERVSKGEFGYVDGADRVLCRLDVQQADFSKVTGATGNALLIIEGTTAHTPEHVEQTAADAIALLTRHCGGTAEIVAHAH